MKYIKNSNNTISLCYLYFFINFQNKHEKTKIEEVENSSLQY